ncbi:LOW QUALITY PROTEIN: transient receptor potential cation channel subfamily M member-like 2 [Saccoglossus kowalevskii]
MLCMGKLNRIRADSIQSVGESEADIGDFEVYEAQSGDEGDSVIDEEIVIPEPVQPSQDLQKKVYKALKRNNVTVLETLLKMRSKISLTLLAQNYLRDLYHSVVTGADCPMWLRAFPIKLKMNTSGKIDKTDKSGILMAAVGDLLCELLPEQFQSRIELGELYQTKAELASAARGAYPKLYCCSKAPPPMRGIYGTRDLFLWALLSDRQQLATVIFNYGWHESDRPSLIGASLTACKLLNKLSDVIEDMPLTQANELDTHARKYKSIANYVTSECFEEDRQKTRQMVIRNRPQWGNESFLVVSSYLEGKEAESFRIVLNDLWTGNLAADIKWLTFKLLLAIVPLFVVVLDVPDAKWYNYPARWKAYYTAPATKCLLNVIVYVIHLFIFCHFLLTDFHHVDNWLDISIWEQMVIIWVFGMVLEEIRQLTEFGAIGPLQILVKVVDYYMSNWNTIDWLMMWSFHIGLVLRFTVSEDHFFVARIFYIVSMILMFCRLLQFATLWEYLGPKVSMIRLMMTRDLPPFLIVFFVFFLSFGVAYHALLYPNDILSWTMVAEVLAMPYWQLYGELQLEQIEGTDPSCTLNATIMQANPDIPRCPETEKYPWLVPTLVGLYMIVSNILLLNLLIAVWPRCFKYDQPVKEFINLKQREVDECAEVEQLSAAKKGTSSGVDVETLKKMDAVDKKLRDTDVKLTELQECIDGMEENIVKKISLRQEEVLTTLFRGFTEQYERNLAALNPTMSSVETVQNQSITQGELGEILTEIRELRQKQNESMSKVRNALKKNRKLLRTVSEDRLSIKNRKDNNASDSDE